MLQSALLPRANSNTIENVGGCGGGCTGDVRWTDSTFDPTLSIPTIVATHTKAFHIHIEEEAGADVDVAMGIGCSKNR